jgi:hypothetical protein
MARIDDTLLTMTVTNDSLIDAPHRQNHNCLNSNKNLVLVLRRGLNTKRLTGQLTTGHNASLTLILLVSHGYEVTSYLSQ